jgi:hypothetical protein
MGCELNLRSCHADEWEDHPIASSAAIFLLNIYGGVVMILASNDAQASPGSEDWNVDDRFYD